MAKQAGRIDDFHLFEPSTKQDVQEIERRLESQLLSEICGEPKLYDLKSASFA